MSTFITGPDAALAGGTLTLPATVGAVRFAHPDHAGASCQQCHHHTGAAGRNSCNVCHRGTNRRDVLHQQCTRCHLSMKQQAKPAGPVKLCSQCHK